MAVFTVTTLADENDAETGVGPALGAGLSLREAIALANADSDADTIEFASNLSGGTITLDGAALAITEAVTIVGDIDGNNSRDITIDGNNSTHLIQVIINDGDTGDTDVTLNGLTLTNGRHAYQYVDGGGVVAVGADTGLLIERSLITGNTSNVGGGGVFAYESSVTLSSVEIANNTAIYGGGVLVLDGALSVNSGNIHHNEAFNGGGILADGTSVSIYGTSLSYNAASRQDDDFGAGGGLYLIDSAVNLGPGVSGSNGMWGNNAYVGGGVYSENSDITVSSYSMYENQSTVAGGGFYIDGGSAEISDSVINSSQSFEGGGIYLQAADVDIIDTFMGGNTANVGGGAFVASGGTLVVVGSKLDSNIASDQGGGIAVMDGSAIITSSQIVRSFGGDGSGIYAGPDYLGGGVRSVEVIQSLLAGNRAEHHGGGIYAASTDLRLYNTVVAHNIASFDQTEGDGGGLYYYSPSNSDFTAELYNSVIAQNVLEYDTTNDVYGSVTAFSSLIQDAASAGGVVHGDNGNMVGIDPLLGPPVDYSDYSPVIVPGPGSPLINAGDASFLPNDVYDLDDDGDTAEPLPLDFLGNPRITGDGLDIGVVELLDPSMGADTLEPEPEVPELLPTTGADEIDLSLYEETELFAGDGADSVTGSDRDEVVYGNLGDDVLTGGGGTDNLYGGKDNDDVRGGDGDDAVYGNLGDDVIGGDSGNDVLYGGQGDDESYGNTGIDILYGGLGSDTSFGGQDGDVLYGNLDNDALFGNLGNDLLYGGQGDDTLVGGEGRDTLIGGKGADFFSFPVATLTQANVIADYNAAEGDVIDIDTSLPMPFAIDGDNLIFVNGLTTVTVLGVTDLGAIVFV